MKFNKNKRMFLAMYTAMMSAVMLTGFVSSTEAPGAECCRSRSVNGAIGSGRNFR